METFCTSGANHSKYRPTLTSSSFYHASPYSRTLRQNEYNWTSRGQQSTLLWQERHQPKNAASKGRICSIALVVIAFTVLVAVLSIAGLALYMGALYSDTATSLLSFSCSAKVLRGDRFTGPLLQEKTSRYKQLLETLYQRSPISSSLVSCVIEQFGNDTLTIYFKITLNRRKIPRSVTNIEKTLKNILLNDAVSRRPIFRNVRFDPRSISVRQSPEIDSSYQRVVTKPKEPIVKLTPKQNVLTKLPKKKTVTSELDVKNKDPLGGQGTFHLSKTDADITEQKSHQTIRTETNTFRSLEKMTTQVIKTTTMKETSAISELYKIGDKILTTTLPTTTKRDTETDRKTTINALAFAVPPHAVNIEPWIPIHRDPEIATRVNPTFPPFSVLNKKQPIYTSFTNPGLTFHTNDTETLGSTSIISHPIPVNKISDGTEPSVWKTTEQEESENEEPEGFVEVETLKYVPGSSANPPEIQWKENKTDQPVLKNISSIFHSLASSLDIGPDEASEVIKKIDSEEPTVGQGHVEVVDVDEANLMMQTQTSTRVPLVTLIPVKSNSGVSRPLRPRPKLNFNNSEESVAENRSFPTDPFFKQSNTDLIELQKKTYKFIHTEVVTSISSEVNKVKINKNAYKQSTTPMYVQVGKNPVVSVTSMNSSVSSSQNFNIITPEKLRQLSQISKLNTNITQSEGGISNKAVSSSFGTNQAGFHILTKNFNKIPTSKDEIKKVSSSYDNISLTVVSNRTECNNFTVTCGNGQCLPDTTRCNQLVDCNDGADEKNCNCADYLRSQFLLRKICDGVVDCWDYSDEIQCEWCRPGQYICGNSKVCISRTKICDGKRDCPHGDDERQCVTVAPAIEAADEFPYHSEGYLLVRKHGKWGKLCVENFESAIRKSQAAWEISDLGQAVCKAITYQNLEMIKPLVDAKNSSQYFELSYTFQNATKSSLSFQETQCLSTQVVKVKCQSLECGARPQAVKQIARIVGGGNAGLGAWPWQVALYKEGEFQCGATLLNDRWLLSAGHCFFHSLEEHWVARLGALRRGTALPSPYEQLRSITRIILHPNYVDAGFINDISLLQMETSVIFSDYVRPICLPAQGAVLKDGRMCTVVGWGQLFEVGRIFPDTLQEVQVPIISTIECRKRTVFLPLYRVTDDMFCAGFERGGRDACLGDSGGPLMCSEPDGRWTLQGITSNGYGCARANRPGVYTKVANYVTWILSYINSEEVVKKNKTACSGHRCPLGECLLKSRLCNSFIECSDGSDEKNCSND